MAWEPSNVPHVSYMWAIPAAVLVVTAGITSRMSVGLRHQATTAEAELAEAAEAIDVVGGFRAELSETTARLESLIAVVRSPMRAARQARRTARHWWSRARRSSTKRDVPSTP